MTAIMTTAERIIQSVCELQEVPPLDHPETLVISVEDLRTIIENRLTADKVTVEQYNAAFDPANDAFGGAFKDGFREGWLFAKDPGFEDRQELEEDYHREVDIAPAECWDAYRSHYFAMLPLAAIPKMTDSTN